MATKIVHAIHQFDDKIGTVEVLDDHTAARLISTGMAREATEDDEKAAEKLAGARDEAAGEAKKETVQLTPAAGEADAPSAEWPKPRLVTAAVDAGMERDAAQKLTREELVDAIAHHRALAAQG